MGLHRPRISPRFTMPPKAVIRITANHTVTLVRQDCLTDIRQPVSPTFHPILTINSPRQYRSVTISLRKVDSIRANPMQHTKYTLLKHTANLFIRYNIRLTVISDLIRVRDLQPPLQLKLFGVFQHLPTEVTRCRTRTWYTTTWFLGETYNNLIQSLDRPPMTSTTKCIPVHNSDTTPQLD